MNPKQTNGVGDLELVQEQLLRMQKRHDRFRRGVFLSFGSIFVVAFLLCTAGYLMAQSGAAQAFVYSGYLEDNGKPVDGLRQVFVQIHSKSAGTALVCGQGSAASPITITFVRGRFKIALASCIGKLNGKSDYWIEFQIKSGTAFKPLNRAKLGVVPFARHANITCTSVYASFPGVNQYESIVAKCPSGYVVTGGGLVNGNWSSLEVSHFRPQGEDGFACEFGGLKSGAKCIARCCKFQ